MWMNFWLPGRKICEGFHIQFACLEKWKIGFAFLNMHLFRCLITVIKVVGGQHTS